MTEAQEHAAHITAERLTPDQAEVFMLLYSAARNSERHVYFWGGYKTGRTHTLKLLEIALKKANRSVAPSPYRSIFPAPDLKAIADYYGVPCVLLGDKDITPIKDTQGQQGEQC
jgi:hypothetical protein